MTGREGEREECSWNAAPESGSRDARIWAQVSRCGKQLLAPPDLPQAPRTRAPAASTQGPAAPAPPELSPSRQGRWGGRGQAPRAYL